MCVEAGGRVDGTMVKKGFGSGWKQNINNTLKEPLRLKIQRFFFSFLFFSFLVLASLPGLDQSLLLLLLTPPTFFSPSSLHTPRTGTRTHSTHTLARTRTEYTQFTYLYIYICVYIYIYIYIYGKYLNILAVMASLSASTSFHSSRLVERRAALEDERRRERIQALESDIARRQLEQSRQREQSLVVRGAELEAATQALTQSLNQSAMVEQELRSDSYALARHLKDTVDELNRSQETAREMAREMSSQQQYISSLASQREAADASVGRMAADLDASRRDTTQARIAADLERSQRRQIEASLRAKHETINRQAHESTLLRSRVKDAATARDQLTSELTAKNSHVERLTRIQMELEERLGMTRQQLQRTEQVVDEARTRAEQQERDFNFRYAAVDQERQSALHELESTRGVVDNQRTELARLRSQVADYESFVDKLRAEIRGRDEALDAKQREIRSWADECDRVRREVDDARRKVVDVNAAHAAQARDYQVQIQQLQAQVGSAEVEKSVAASAKLDLIADVNRIQKRLAEREAEIVKMTRLLEQKDQAIAEMTPYVKQVKSSSRRAMASGTTATKPYGKPTATAKVAQPSLRLTSTSSKWRY